MVLAAIWLVAMAVSVGLKSWLNVMSPGVAVEQSGTRLTLVNTSSPVQKTSDSGMVPVRSIGSAVLAVTVPLSIKAPLVSRDE